MIRPWITVGELERFTERTEVKNLTPLRTSVMINLAESKIIAYCHHDFSDDVKYPELPESVKNATYILAEAFCYNDSRQTTGVIKSETYDDYSYTIESSETSTDFDVLGIATLLKPYVEDAGDMFLRVGVI